MAYLRNAGVLFFFAAGAAHAGEVSINDAIDAYENKQYQRCADVIAQLEREKIPLIANSELIHAECLSDAGHVDAALHYLDTQLPSGRISLDDLQHKDRPGLNAIRKTEQWPALLAKAQKLDVERQAHIDQPLRKELLARGDKDQQVRQAAIDAGNTAEAWNQTMPVDQDNTAWLKKVVAEKGWPGFSLVGADAAQAAFLIVQHSPDATFQAQMLPMLQAEFANHNVDGQELALLTDRVLNKQGKLQIYGTQFHQNDDGSMSMDPVEDEANLDARRHKMGMQPIAEYKQSLSEMYHQPVK